jgi:hypothetical protein
VIRTDQLVWQRMRNHGAGGGGVKMGSECSRTADPVGNLFGNSSENGERIILKLDSEK